MAGPRFQQAEIRKGGKSERCAEGGLRCGPGPLMNPLQRVFENLDRWRHLPAYQLERRVDIFFSVYLKGLVEELTGVPLDPQILPELPIKRDLIRVDHPTHRSVKVDYALFSTDRQRVFFVELKTDGHSRRDVQDQYLEAAKRLGFQKIAQGVCDIIRKTTAHQKYHHLASALMRLGYITVPHELRGLVYPEPRLGSELTGRLAEIQVTAADAMVDVIYVQPEGTEGVRCIDFRQFAEYVARHDDPLSQVFAQHLLRWRVEAGSCEPF